MTLTERNTEEIDRRQRLFGIEMPGRQRDGASRGETDAMGGPIVRNRDELVDALVQLDPRTFEEVIASAYQQRHGPEEDVSQDRPDSQATPLQFAEWLAKRHLSSDMAIERVVYLPKGAPPDEIRLLEVNRLLHPPDPDNIEPLDFTPDTEPAFKVFVADVTTDQWERIKQAPDAILPAEWKLEGNRIFTRG